MPMYVWECVDCKTQVEITRPISRIDEAPDGPCEKCDNACYTRIVYPPRITKAKGFILNGSGWHDTEYSKYRSLK